VAGRREGKLQHMLRTQCRAQHDSEAASLRIAVTSKPTIAFDLDYAQRPHDDGC
jgi:hypothetical protein